MIQIETTSIIEEELVAFNSECVNAVAIRINVTGDAKAQCISIGIGCDERTDYGFVRSILYNTERLVGNAW